MVYVKCDNGFCGLYAHKTFQKDQIVHVLSKSNIVSLPTRTSIRVGSSNHVEDHLGKYINHSCDPTCEIRGFNVVAIKDIKIMDEVTFDYSKNELSLASPFKCTKCNKLIKSYPAPCNIDKN